MKYTVLVLLLFISTCYCNLDFSERPRNCSFELLYYTQLETGGHLVISPFGIWTLMSSVALGTSGNSYKQLSKAFVLPENRITLIKGYKNLTREVLKKSNDISLTSTNFVFLDNQISIYPAYKTTIQNDFGASLKVLNFYHPKSVEVANKLIEKSSGLKNVLQADDFLDSIMILSNVISFKGLWKFPFEKKYTSLEPFYDEDDKVIGNVNMMAQTGPFAFLYLEPLKSCVVELPYGSDGKYSMLIILPYSKDKIADIYKNFSKVNLKDISKRLIPIRKLKVIIKLPRFHIRTNLTLEKPLNGMGVYDIFQPSLANFQYLTKNSIYISAIVHTADIEVTESGTVASGATKAGATLRMLPPEFYANRPFIYLIMEKTTTTVLFSGIYSKPTVY